MSVASSIRTKLVYTLVWCLVPLVALLLVAGQVLRTNMLTESRTSLDAYIDGEVARPFAYRVFLPQVMRGINAITPAGLSSSLDELGERIAAYGMTGWKIQSGSENKYPRSIVWLSILQFASLVGYALVGAMLYSTICDESSSYRWIVAPILLIFLVPIVYKGLGHIYDFTAVLFMACLLWAMAAKRHVVYLLIFAVSCLNKETTLLMLVAYAAVFFGRMEFSRYATMLAAQLAIFLAIYVPIRILFEGNPGSGMEVHIHEQYEYYRSHLNNAYILTAFSVAIVFFLVLLTFRWNEKPQFLRRASLMIPPLVALVFYGAAPGELRNLYEIMPLISLLVLCSVVSSYRILRKRAVPKLVG